MIPNPTLTNTPPFQTTGTILVVDDTPTNIQVLVDVLSETGYRVGVATSGEAALQRVANSTPDLILLDVMMPGIDGFETCRRLKADAATRDIPVMFMTALADTSDKVKGLNLGAVDYITKPIQQAEVLARIRVHMQLAQLMANLEHQVADRTAHLQTTLDRLQSTQLQLVQSEKLSSLGQLVAGVAHEINNPVNFIYGNLVHTDEYTQQLLELIALFHQEFPKLTPALEAYLDEIDFDFLRGDLPNMLGSMKLGADRIRQIVLSLRNFSRIDEAEMKSVDLADGIDSTLVILRGRLKARHDVPEITVVTHYNDRKPVECFASQLNQVFMNLLANAIDALHEAVESGQLTEPRIEIRTEYYTDDRGDRVRVTIADNGLGIPADLQPRLFDPFFTTKPAGKGTGLGLAICHQIVTEQHGGTITCESSPKAGTTFTIEFSQYCSSH